MYFKITGINRQVLISMCPYIGQIVAGYGLSWTGPIFPKLRDLSQSPLSYVPSETQISLIASVIYVGALPGPFIVGWLSNIWGRKPCIIIGGLVSCAAYIILLWANNLAMLYVGRLLAGLSGSITTVINLVYVGETASSNIRGILLTCLGIFTTCGLILLFAVGSYLSYFNATSVGLATSIAFTISTLFVPESLIFYLLKDNKEEVKKQLKDLGRENDIHKILESKEEYKNTSSKRDWIELFTIRSNKRALFIAGFLNIFQYGSGFSAVLAFSGSIFEMSGLSVDSNTSMLIVGSFQLCGSSLASIFVERNGRKTLLLISSVVCCLSTLSLGIYFYLDHIHYAGINKVRWLPLVLLILFFIGYDIGLGIIPNVLMGELFTLNVRSKGTAVVAICASVTGFLVMTAYGPMTENLGIYGSFWIFSFPCFIAVFFIIFCIPETKGKSLLEILEILGKE